jgi:hypothetical protein
VTPDTHKTLGATGVSPRAALQSGSATEIGGGVLCTSALAGRQWHPASRWKCGYLISASMIQYSSWMQDVPSGLRVR